MIKVPLKKFNSYSKLSNEQETENNKISQNSFTDTFTTIQKSLGNKTIEKIIIQQMFDVNLSIMELLDIFNSKNVKNEQEKDIENLLVDKNKQLKNKKNVDVKDKLTQPDDSKTKVKSIEDQILETKSFTKDEIYNAKIEWDSTPGKHHFHSIISKDGERDYRPLLFFKDWESVKSNFTQFNDQDLKFVSFLVMRRAYSINGKDLSDILKDLDMVNFFGVNIIVRKKLKPKLENIKKLLRDDVSKNPQLINAAGGGVFAPRLVRDTDKPSNLSNHALGLAIDINVQANPLISNKKDILVIEAVTGVNLGKEQNRATLREASKKFSLDFNEQWKEKIETRIDELTSKEKNKKIKLNKEEKEEKSKLERIKEAMSKRHETLEEYKKTGFFNLSDKVIDTFTKIEDFKWGGNYENKKDFHHFEIIE